MRWSCCESLGRTAAAIALAAERHGQAHARTLDVQEISIWQKLKHTNLVQLLDVFETDMHLFLVTELMKGGDLFKHLTKHTFFSELDAASLARQVRRGPKTTGPVNLAHGLPCTHADSRRCRLPS